MKRDRKKNGPTLKQNKWQDPIYAREACMRSKNPNPTKAWNAYRKMKIKFNPLIKPEEKTDEKRNDE